MVKLINIFSLENKPEYSDRVVGPFDEGKKYLESIEYKIISLEELARLRLDLCNKQSNPLKQTSNINDTQGRVSEGVILLPGNIYYLTKASPIMNDPVNATTAHSKARGDFLRGKEFYLSEDQIKDGLKDAVQISSRKTLIQRVQDEKIVIFAIPTNKFEDEILTRYAFGDVAKEYGLLLKKLGIKELPIFLPPIKETKAFARQVYATSTYSGNNAGLECTNYVNLSDHSMFGIRQEKIK